VTRRFRAAASAAASAAAWVAASGAALLAGCDRGPPLVPPAHVAYGNLPVSGSLADARAAGFAACLEMTNLLRCRRGGVMLEGHGPFEAAVDLAGSDGRGGFRQLTLWHDRDQYAVYAIAEALEKAGWRSCATATGGRGMVERGDQQVYSRPGAPVRFSMDLSYWGKRRFRILPAWSGERTC